MANFTALKTAINNAIKTNGNEEITGAILQAILDAMVETLGDSAITDLENAITTEVTNRENAVGNVAADLAAEVQARQALDYNVNNRINAEEYNRQNADAALSQTMNQGFQTLGSQMTALNAAISALNAAYQNGYLYGGIATPSSSPSNNKCFYIALQGGTYTNFGGVGVVEGINIIKNDSGWKVEHIYDQTTLLNEFYLLRQQVIRAISSIDPIVIQGDVTNAPDEEDLTSDAQHLLKFKDRAYSPLNFSGLGMKILRKNIAPLSDSAAFNGFVEGVTAEETLAGTPELIFWDRMNTRFVGIKDGVYYAAWTDDDNYVPVSTSLVYMYNGTPYQWTGSDFIVDETEVPNLVNCLTQDMINEANTIYIIRYDYTLKENITIPANCVLEFDGGSVSGAYTITGQQTTLTGIKDQIWIDGYTTILRGTYTNDSVNVRNFGAIPLEETKFTTILNNLLYTAFPIYNIEIDRGMYYVTAPIVVGFRKKFRGSKVGHPETDTQGVTFVTKADFSTLYPFRGVVETVTYATTRDTDFMHMVTIENIRVQPYQNNYESYGFDFGFALSHMGEHSNLYNCFSTLAKIANIIVDAAQAVCTIEKCSTWGAVGNGTKNSGFGLYIGKGAEITGYPYTKEGHVTAGGVRVLELSGDGNANSHICVGDYAYSVYVEGLKSEAHKCEVRCIGTLGKAGVRNNVTLIGYDAMAPTDGTQSEAFACIGYSGNEEEYECAPWIHISCGRNAGFTYMVKDYVHNKEITPFNQSSYVNYDFYGAQIIGSAYVDLPPFIRKGMMGKNALNIQYREDFFINDNMRMQERYVASPERYEKKVGNNEDNLKVYEKILLDGSRRSFYNNNNSEVLAIGPNGTIIRVDKSSAGYYPNNAEEAQLFYDFTNDLLAVMSNNGWRDTNGFAAKTKKGVSLNRPQLDSNDVGYQYFDTTLGLPIWWTGTYWMNAIKERITWPVTYNLTNVHLESFKYPDANAQFGIRLVADSGHTLPASITITMGGTTLTEGTDYTYNADNNGYVLISGIGGSGGVTGALVITASAT